MAGAAVLIFAAVVLAMAVIVVVAVHVRIIGKLSRQEGLYRRVGLAADAAIELNARLSQRHLGTAADAAAQEHLHLGVGQKSGQRAVSLAIGVHHLGGNHLAVLDVVELELLCMAKMLENHAVFIGDCNSHRICFLSQNKATFGGDRRPPALLPATGGGCPVAQAVVPAGNEEALAVARPNGIVHVLPGTYPVTQQIAVSIPGLTIQGTAGSVILLQAPVVPFLCNGGDNTIDGLTMTSDNPYPVEFIQVAGDGNRILNCLIYGPDQPGDSSTWVVNRGFVTQGNATNLLVRNNVFHTLRQPAYLNPGSTGMILYNVVYNTRGYVVDQATFLFSGNSWGLPANAVDILHRLGAKSAILVSSPYHLRRVKMNFMAVDDKISYRTAAADDENWHWWFLKPNGWVIAAKELAGIAELGAEVR